MTRLLRYTSEHCFCQQVTMSSLSPLTAVSPIDGRYHDKTKVPYVSVCLCVFITVSRGWLGPAGSLRHDTSSQNRQGPPRDLPFYLFILLFLP